MSLLQYVDHRFKHDFFRSIHFDEREFVFFIIPFRTSYKKIIENHLKPRIKKEFQMESEIASTRYTHGGFHEKIWQQICEACIVVADLSEWNANVYYELGLAHALSKRCIQITRDVSKLPSDLRHIDTIIYEYGFFKKDLLTLENKLVAAIEHISKKNNTKIIDFKLWRQTKGSWMVQNNELELSAPSITPDACYIWNPIPFSDHLNIKFRLKFIKPTPLDFRISLFASNTNETYQSSKHLLLIFPWEWGGQRVDGLEQGRVQSFHVNNTSNFIVGQHYYYEVTIDPLHVVVKIDGVVVFQEPTQKFQYFFIVQPSYWGFSSVGGHFIVSELEATFN